MNEMKQRAFTLIEVLVVIAIIGVLATAIVVNMSSARSKSRDARRKGDLKELFSAIEMYYDAEGNMYPLAESGNGTQKPQYSVLVPKYLPEASYDPYFRPSNDSSVHTDYAYSVQGNKRNSFAIGGFLENPSGSSCRLGTSIALDITTISLEQDVGGGDQSIGTTICK